MRLLELERTGAVGFLRAYLFKIASNLAIDRLRSRNTRERIDAHCPDFLEELVLEGPVERQVFAADEMSVFWDCLAELPEPYRRSFVLHRIDNPRQSAGLYPAIRAICCILPRQRQNTDPPCRWGQRWRFPA